MANRTLYLSLKAELYEVIESGEKTEDYRELKEYWTKRLVKIKDYRRKFTHTWQAFDYILSLIKDEDELHDTDCPDVAFTKYDRVKFLYGYTNRTMTFEVEDIYIGKGKPEWGAPEDKVFIIKLGKRID